jgi:uncharacterized protein (TIGR02145 family)
MALPFHTGIWSQEQLNLRMKKPDFYFIYPYHKIDGISSESEMISAYGMHYNWHAVVNPDGLCPQGWRVPATEEGGATSFLGSFKRQ